MSESQPIPLDAKSFLITNLFERLKQIPLGEKMQFSVTFVPNAPPSLITVHLEDSPIGPKLVIQGLPAQALKSSN